MSRAATPAGRSDAAAGPACRECGGPLGDPVRQPAERNEGTIALHYHCPDCGAGGYRVIEPGGRVVRDGGRAFNGANV